MKASNGIMELELTEHDILDIIIDPSNKKEIMGLIRGLVEGQNMGKFSAEQIDEIANKIYDDLRRQGSAC